MARHLTFADVERRSAHMLRPERNGHAARHHSLVDAIDRDDEPTGRIFHKWGADVVQPVNAHMHLLEQRTNTCRRRPANEAAAIDEYDDALRLAHLERQTSARNDCAA